MTLGPRSPTSSSTLRNLSPKGIYTSGKSATAVGLTAPATQDSEGRWTIEAGALVLADQGLACVDELDKMKADDRDALNEAMEQQTVSVAKADIVTTLRARCTLLGAANPKLGRFDDFTALAEQINMPPNLLSRFDLIFMMKDVPDQKQDEILAERHPQDPRWQPAGPGHRCADPQEVRCHRT